MPTLSSFLFKGPCHLPNFLFKALQSTSSSECSAWLPPSPSTAALSRSSCGPTKLVRGQSLDNSLDLGVKKDWALHLAKEKFTMLFNLRSTLKIFHYKLPS